MGAVTGMLGLGGGASGTGYSSPSSANILNPATTQQATDQYNNAQTGLGYQQQLLTALQGQNGLQNQSSVYNQLQGVANGTGANPAQAMLNQSTGQNVANQAALMAGQRGSSQNAGLIARQAAQQGANTQQQAAGQGATMQATQSLNALNSLGNLANSQVTNQIGATTGYNQAAQGEQQNVLNAIAAQNNANVGMQSNINQANAGLAQTTMGQQSSILGGLANGVGGLLAKGGKVSEAPKVKMAQGGQYDNSFQPMSDDQWSAMQANPNQAPAPISQPTPMQTVAPAPPAAAMPMAKPKGPQSKFGAFLQAATTPAGKAPAQDAGPFNMASNQGERNLQQGTSALASGLGRAVGNLFKSSPPQAQAMAGGPQDNPIPAPAPGDEDDTTMMAAEGGKVPALVSPGEQYLRPRDVKEVLTKGKSPLEVGERIPGKPKYRGNDYRNDVVKKNLDTGGFVIPNKIMQGKDPHWQAMQFVRAHMAKNKKGL